MLLISNNVSIPDDEVELQAIRAQGAGGQHVNKVSSAIHLRFDIGASSLPDFYKEQLTALQDQRITNDGVIVLKVQKHRSQQQNRELALERLQTLIREAAMTQKPRKATKPSRNSQRKRVDKKTQRGNVKTLRKKVDY